MTYTVNCSILWPDLPLLERPAAAKAAGFDAVEFWWPFESSVPADSDVTRFENAVINAGVRLTGLNFSAGNMSGGDRGLVSWPSRSAEFADNIDVVAGIGEQLGCKGFNALYGNRMDGVSAQEQDAVAMENLNKAAQGVDRIGGTVLLEPISGAAKYPLLKAAHALDIIAKVRATGAENIKLLADFYHLAVNGDDVADVIENHAADFGHIQIADAPGRGEPGTGNLPLDAWIGRSIELGYTGHIGLEYKATAEEPFGWLREAKRIRSAHIRTY